MKYKESALSLCIRYALLVLLGLFNLAVIYALLTPTTVHLSKLALSLFYNVSLAGTTLLVDGTEISLVRACIAGSAYYLLLVLNFSSAMDIRRRVSSIAFVIAAFLLVNVLRITVFSHLYISGFQYFDVTHLFFWNFVSIFMVVIVWFASVKIFDIRSIPVYSDIIGLLKVSRKRK